MTAAILDQYSVNRKGRTGNERNSNKLYENIIPMAILAKGLNHRFENTRDHIGTVSTNSKLTSNEPE